MATNEKPGQHSARLWLTGVCQTHESKNVGVRVRGTGFGIEHGVLLGTATGIGRGREGDARSRNRCAQGQWGGGAEAFNDEKNKDFRDRDLYIYCFSLPDGNFTAYQSPVLIGTNIKELKIPPNDPVGQRAYDAVAKAAEGEIVTFIYDFPKPGTKASAPKETLEVRVGKQGCGVSYFKS
jgi:hypothetical protein